MQGLAAFLRGGPNHKTELGQQDRRGTGLGWLWVFLNDGVLEHLRPNANNI